MNRYYGVFAVRREATQESSKERPFCTRQSMPITSGSQAIGAEISLSRHNRVRYDGKVQAVAPGQFDCHTVHENVRHVDGATVNPYVIPW